MKTMNVVLSSDENYQEYLGVTITSLLKNNEAYDFINVYIISLGIVSKKLFFELEKQYKCRIEFIDFENYIPRLKLNLMWDISMSSYARLFLTEMLPSDCEKVLYIDCDTLIVGNLEKLYETNINGYYAAGVIDTASDENKIMTKMPITDPYINAGVLLINLSKWRESNITDSFLNYINECNGSVFHHDQGVINHVLAGKIMILDPSMNLMSPFFSMKYSTFTRLYNVSKVYYSKEQIEKAKEHPVIIHFTEAFLARPWVKGSRHPYTTNYLDTMKDSNWNNMILKNNKESRKMVFVRFIYTHLPYNIAHTIMTTLHFVNHLNDD